MAKLPLIRTALVASIPASMIALLSLKLVGLLDGWSWWWALSPAVAIYAAVLVVGACGLLARYVATFLWGHDAVKDWRH